MLSSSLLLRLITSKMFLVLKVPFKVSVCCEANLGAHTFLDRQTPLHYAAKNDAVGSIRLLLQAGATISCTDYKNRTPLQLAANMGTADMIN